MNNFPEFVPQFVYEGKPAYELTDKTPNVQVSLLALFCWAIAYFEGFYIPETDRRYPSIAQRHNNPGNLRPIGASTGFRTFETPEQGFEALGNQVVRNINRGLTLVEFFLGKEGVYPGYAPLGDNDPEVMENYINFVASTMNVAKDVDLRYYFRAIANDRAGPLGTTVITWLYKPFWM